MLIFLGGGGERQIQHDKCTIQYDMYITNMKDITISLKAASQLFHFLLREVAIGRVGLVLRCAVTTTTNITVSIRCVATATNDAGIIISLLVFLLLPPPDQGCQV